MSEAQLPHIVRPLVSDDTVEIFQSTLSEIGIETTLNPAMHLITTAELQSIPQHVKQSAHDVMIKLADNLTVDQAESADVLKARLFYRKQIGYVSLSLAVSTKVGEERRSITNVLERHGADIERSPFKNFRYSLIVARCMGYPAGSLKPELYDAINAAYPKRVKLGSPTF